MVVLPQRPSSLLLQALCVGKRYRQCLHTGKPRLIDLENDRKPTSDDKSAPTTADRAGEDTGVNARQDKEQLALLNDRSPKDRGPRQVDPAEDFFNIRRPPSAPDGNGSFFTGPSLLLGGIPKHNPIALIDRYIKIGRAQARRIKRSEQSPDDGMPGPAVLLREVLPGLTWFPWQRRPMLMRARRLSSRCLTSAHPWL